MTARVGAILVVTALWVTAPRAADAQVWTVESDRPALGVSIGRASSIDSGTGPAWNATFELPMFPTWRLRADVGRVHWRFAEDMRGRGFPQRTAMTRASITLARTPPVPPTPVCGYIGGGPGVYWFPAPGNQGFTRFGLHALAGMEFALPRDRAKIVAELRVDGTRTEGTVNVSPLQGSAVLGVRWKLGR